MTGKSIRKIWHMCGTSVFPILSFFISIQILILLITAAAFLFLTLDFLRLRKEAFNSQVYRHLKDFMKEKEKNDISGASYVLIGEFLCFYFFERDIAIVSLFFLAFGDPLSVLIAERSETMSKRRQKIEGFFASLFVCLITGIFFMTMGLNLTVIQITIGSLLASVFSIVHLALDDNLTIPISSSLVMTLIAKI